MSPLADDHRRSASGHRASSGADSRVTDGSELHQRDPYGSEAYGAQTEGPRTHTMAGHRGETCGTDPTGTGPTGIGTDPRLATSEAHDRGSTTLETSDGRARSSRRLAPAPEGTRRYLVLGVGSGEDDAVALDMSSGVLLRLHSTQLPLPDGTIQPFDVVDAALSTAGPIDDLARPETVLVSGPLVRAGVARGRRVAKQLRRLIAPPQPHLLGFPGSTWPYWEFHGDQPSVALVTPSRGPMLFRRSEDGTAWVRFGWYRTDNWLPVQDPLAQTVLATSRRHRLSGKQLAEALGFRPVYLVVAVSRPRAGYCSKGVLAILPGS